MKRVFILTTCCLLTMVQAFATDYYVSTTGSDTNDGKSREAAFATLGKAQSLVTAGDNVYILPGTYQITESQISATSDPYKIVFNFKQNGTLGKPIRFIGLTEGGQRPVFDMSAVNPAGYRVTAFYVTGSYLVFRNFEVIGVMVNITDHTQSENFRIRNGHHNTFDNIACHDGMGIGFYLTNNSHHNLFVNCDGYNNYDSVSENGKGGQNDGFGCHVTAGNEGNIFIGCRAWNNTDDGFDLINCYSPVTFCYSIAYKNGYDADGNARQDGNGFKAGGFGMSATAITLPEEGAPRHQVYHCLAVQNKSNGIYSNHHLGGLDFTYNTSVNSRYYSNFSMVNRKGPAANENTDVSGYNHRLEYNLSVSQWDRNIGSIDATDASNTINGNSFTWDAANNKWVNNYTATFVSTNVDRLKRARLANGMLDPETTLTVYQQESYTGMGCDFNGYEAAVAAARELSGAGKEDGEVINTYISEATTWNFSNLTAGTTIEQYTDFNGLIIRATEGSHACTVNSDGSLSLVNNGNDSGSPIETSYLAKNKEAADDLNNTTYDRCLAFNTSVAGTTTVTFSAKSDNANRKYMILFKAKDKTVIKKEVSVTKAKNTISLYAEEAGSFFIVSTLSCYVHEVKFELGNTTTGITALDNSTISPISHLADSPYDNCVYDLSGRKWSNSKLSTNGRCLRGKANGQLPKGIVIQNGKKYLIR